MSTATTVPISADQKYCSECARVIMRRAEICPGCGCRQTAPSQTNSSSGPFNSPMTGQLIILILANFLWSGAGNMAVGDKRGARFAAVNILIFIVSFFTAFIPSLLYFVNAALPGQAFGMSNPPHVFRLPRR